MMKPQGAKKTLKVAISCILLVLVATSSIGQGFRANHWVFPMGNGLDFSGGAPTAETYTVTGEMGTSAMSDINGDLLFYSNGNKVWEANGSVMFGGNNLVGDPQATQSSIIVPATISTTRYYLFVNDANAGPNGFQYYDVEMTLNGGNGGVVGPTLLIDTATEKVCATRHADDRGHWVVAHRWESDEFHAFLVDQNGVNSTPIVSAVGIPHLNSAGAGEETGQMKISPDGSWIATCNFSSGYVQLFRFNNATGVVSDPITLASGSSVYPYGVEFSADSKKLFYARRVSSGSNPAGIHQFDLDHASIDCLLASETVVSNNNPFKLYTDLQLGNDKKIYVSYYKPSPFNADTLGVIQQPEVMCPDCDYVDNHLLLDNGLFSGVTNFVSSYLSDGITYEFGTNCENDTTWFMPEDTLGLDSVRWVFGDPSSGTNQSTSLHAPHIFSSPDTFLVTLYAHRGTSTDTFTRDVIVWDTAVNLLGNDTTLCNGQPVSFEADWYDACLIWNDSSTNTTYTTTQEGWHWVEVYHQSCVWRDSVHVTVVNQPPQFSLGNDTSVCADVNFEIDPDLQNAYYTWQDGSHDTTFLVSSTGTYWLQASNACGTFTDTLNVVLNEAAQPVLQFPEDTIGCDTVGIELDVTFEGAVYTWNDGFAQPIRTILEPGTYWVEVGNSCDTVSDTIEVGIDAPIVSALPLRTVLCADGSNALELLATADSQSVVWSTGQEAPSISVSQPGTYAFAEANACGATTDTVEVLGYDTTYRLDIGGDTTLCSLADSVTIGDGRDDFPWNYSWSDGANAMTRRVTAGMYHLTASHRCDTVSLVAHVRKAPRIFITDSVTTEICQGDTLSLRLSSNEARHVQWSTGDTTMVIAIDEPGVYEVEIVDTAGCVHVLSRTFTDFCPGTVGIGNVFTPNGDGTNDQYCLDLENVVTFDFRVFNRWGTEVFHSHDEAICWDGETHGNPSPAGTYFYLLETTDAMGIKRSFRGSLTLIRS